MRKKHYTIVLGLGLLLAMLLFLETAPLGFAAVPKSNTTNSFTTQAAPNQILVKYKSDLSPQSLQLKVEERKTIKSSTFGSIRLLFDNLKYKMGNKTLPEEQLTRIQQADAQVGAKNKTRVFDAKDENQRNLFVIEISTDKTPEEAIRVYEKLPEVEYAEPNYTFYAF